MISAKLQDKVLNNKPITQNRIFTVSENWQKNMAETWQNMPPRKGPGGASAQCRNSKISCNIPKWRFRKSHEISSPHLKPFSIESRKTSPGGFGPPPVIGLKYIVILRAPLSLMGPKPATDPPGTKSWLRPWLQLFNPRPAGGGGRLNSPSGFSRIAKIRRRAAPPGFHPPYPPSFPQLLCNFWTQGHVRSGHQVRSSDPTTK